MKENDTWEENMREILFDRLTDNDEEKLQTAHADQADGVLDDDLVDDYERWLENLTLKDMLKIISPKDYAIEGGKNIVIS